jgi:transposase
MSSVTCFVGLDYHQDSVQVCVLDAKGRQLLNRSCSNHWREVAAVVRSVGVVKRAAIEACCGAADLAEELVERAGWAIDLAHPQYVARMKRSPDKSDYSDSSMLADLTRVGYLPRVHLASSYERDLRQLVNHRQALVDQRRSTKLRAGAVLREQRAKPSFDCSRWTKAWMAWARSAAELSDQGRWIVNDLLDELTHLDRKIISAEARLRQATANDPMIERLMNEPGIGEVTAWVLRAYVGRFDRFNTGRQLSRYCGLSPCNASSGTKQADAGLIKGCNKLLRATLIQAGHRLINTEPRWRQLSDSMKRRGKAASVIVAAVANRWMRGLWHRMLPVQGEVQGEVQVGALPQTPPHFAPPPTGRLNEVERG